MKSNIFIPKKIKVGFQHRDDTYTKKLAYVIYYDQKGILRKETSWKGWIHDEEIKVAQHNPETRSWEHVMRPGIKPEDFDNIPLEGFVLNKKVGGERYSWNPRQTYTRVFDPRGFEFEITIPNLLYILENTNSIKGKGLEGKFVYGWDGKELVLIPESAPELEAIKDFTEMQAVSFSKKDLIPGHLFLTKQNTKVMYIGHFTEYSSSGIATKTKKYFFSEKITQHDKSEMLRLETRSSYQHIAKKLSDVPEPEFAELFESLEHDHRYSGRVEDKLIDMSLQDFKTHMLDGTSYGGMYFETVNAANDMFTVAFYKDGTNDTFNLQTTWRREFVKRGNYKHYSYLQNNNFSYWGRNDETKFKEKMLKEAGHTQGSYYTAEQLYEMFKPKKLITILENGKEEQR